MPCLLSTSTDATGRGEGEGTIPQGDILEPPVPLIQTREFMDRTGREALRATIESAMASTGAQVSSHTASSSIR